MPEISQEQLDALNAKAAKADELQAQYDELSEEHGKLKRKDMNFRTFEKKMKDMTQEELDSLTETEKALRAEQEKFREEQEAFHRGVKDGWRLGALRRLAAGNAELEKELADSWGRIAGEPKTEQEFADHAAEVAALVSSRGRRDEFRSALGVAGAAPKKEERRDFSETDGGKELASLLNFESAK